MEQTYLFIGTVRYFRNVNNRQPALLRENAQVKLIPTSERAEFVPYCYVIRGVTEATGRVCKPATPTGAPPGNFSPDR